MKREPLSSEWDGHVCHLLFKQRPRPAHSRCKAINLWDNAYRINVYTTSKDINGLDIERISYSCFARLDDKEDHLKIISEPSGMLAM